MNFIDYSYNLFKNFSETDFYSDNINSENSLRFAIGKIAKPFSSEDFNNSYLHECEHLIKTELEYYFDDIKFLLEQRNIFNYHNSMSFYTLIYLFWIWNNDFKLDRSDLAQFIKAVYLEALGYKMLDEATDKIDGGRELVYLGLNSISIAEFILSEVFPNSNVPEIIKRHTHKLSQFEYSEKKNRWGNCPIKWDEANKLGFKASPLFSVFEIISSNYKFDANKINKLIVGMTKTTAAMQIMDDFADVEEDLNNGIETLVMSGYYSKYGKDTEGMKSNINDFLNQDRLMKIYITARDLFNEAREIFKSEEDDILGLFNEIQNYKFHDFLKPKYVNDG